MVLAAGVAAEIGDPMTQRPVNNLTSYAGIIPRVSQTGGPDSEACIGSVSHRCNRILKDYLVQSASHIGLHGVADLQEDHHRRDAAGQHANYGIARRYLRIGMHLSNRSRGRACRRWIGCSELTEMGGSTCEFGGLRARRA